mmetsp:Transcript_9063/g.31077  ORF Transcript_9063/g.31077 Transcript_9063/m.31077 type:complete len:347 (+) Transcript_9063:312-1352(+)
MSLSSSCAVDRAPPHLAQGTRRGSGSPLSSSSRASPFRRSRPLHACRSTSSVASQCGQMTLATLTAMGRGLMAAAGANSRTPRCARSSRRARCTASSQRSSSASARQQSTTKSRGTDVWRKSLWSSATTLNNLDVVNDCTKSRAYSASRSSSPVAATSGLWRKAPTSTANQSRAASGRPSLRAHSDTKRSCTAAGALSSFWPCESADPAASGESSASCESGSSGASAAPTASCDSSSSVAFSRVDDSSSSSPRISMAPKLWPSSQSSDLKYATGRRCRKRKTGRAATVEITKSMCDAACAASVSRVLTTMEPSDAWTTLTPNRRSSATSSAWTRRVAEPTRRRSAG